VHLCRLGQEQHISHHIAPQKRPEFSSVFWPDESRLQKEDFFLGLSAARVFIPLFFSPHRIDPTHLDVLFLITPGVGFDVQDRSSLDHVDSGDLQNVSYPLPEPDDGQPDQVGPVGAAGGEDSSRFVIERGVGGQVLYFGIVEGEENDEMGEAFDVLEAFVELFEDFELALNSIESLWIIFPLSGDVFRPPVRGMDYADRFKLDIHD